MCNAAHDGLPGRGRRNGAGGLHRTGIGGKSGGSINWRPGLLRRHGPCLRTGSISARLGLGRLYSQLAFGSLPQRSRDEVRANIATASNLRSTIDEYVQATPRWARLHLCLTSPPSLWSS